VRGVPGRLFLPSRQPSPLAVRVQEDDGTDTTGAPRPEIWIVDADGTGAAPLGVAGGPPVWSPGGTRIAFVGFAPAEDVDEGAADEAGDVVDEP
jgi:hypothetical protein